MPANIQQIRQCLSRDCNFRFPILAGHYLSDKCPVCGGPTQLITYPVHPRIKKQSITNTISTNPEIDVLLDNIRSVFNVGSIFRTADGAGARKLHLCGITPTPNHPKMCKTALGAEFSIPWDYSGNGFETAVNFKNNGYALWALEEGTDSVSIVDALPDLPHLPILLVVGNEIAGIDPGILELCDRKIWIPMQGYKRSLNVAIAFSIAVYFLRHCKPAFNSA